MPRKFFALALLLVAAALTPGVALAQETNATATPLQADQPAERIDANTRLVSATYDSDTGMVTAVIESDVLQDVVLSDAGAFVEGGVVEQREETVRPDETTTIKIPATRTEDGYVGISIATRDTLYAVPIDTSSPMIGGPWTVTDARLAGAMVGLSTIVVAALMLLRYSKMADAESGRVA